MSKAAELAALIGLGDHNLKIGDASAADSKIVFDGNAVDYHVGLDDSTDLLTIGKGSALGTTTEIPTVSGKVKIKLEEGIQSGKILRLKGKGLPSVNSYGTGDLLIHINVWTPQNLSKEEKQFFEDSKESATFKPNPTHKDKSFFDRVKEMFG